MRVSSPLRRYFYLRRYVPREDSVPPIKVQQAIMDVYRCANEAKRIAADADRLSREICPALVRWAAVANALQIVHHVLKENEKAQATQPDPVQK